MREQPSAVCNQQEAKVSTAATATFLSVSNLSFLQNPQFTVDSTVRLGTGTAAGAEPGVGHEG